MSTEHDVKADDLVYNLVGLAGEGNEKSWREAKDTLAALFAQVDEQHAAIKQLEWEVKSLQRQIDDLRAGRESLL